MSSVSIHQPQFIPWVHYFTKIRYSDIFIILDDVDYHKGGLQNRNQVILQGQKYILTVPVKKGESKQINEIKICYQNSWQKKMLRTIVQLYKKENHFEELFIEFSKIINSSPVYMCDLNKKLLLWALDHLKISTKVIMSSDLKVGDNSTQKLINLCHSVKGTTYLSGQGGKAYLDEHKFENQNIKLEYVDFSSDHFYNKSFLADTNAFTNSSIETLFKYKEIEIWR